MLTINIAWIGKRQLLAQAAQMHGGISAHVSLVSFCTCSTLRIINTFRQNMSLYGNVSNRLKINAKNKKRISDKKLTLQSCFGVVFKYFSEGFLG